MTPKRLLIAAGGTGGHMFPARAAADALMARGWSVKLVTDVRGARHATDFPGEPVSEIEASSPFAKNPVKMAQSMVKLGRGVKLSLGIKLTRCVSTTRIHLFHIDTFHITWIHVVG